ncbi:hypothetical protein CRUP_005182, partial [Coryphaenoides rupestris]
TRVRHRVCAERPDGRVHGCSVITFAVCKRVFLSTACRSIRVVMWRSVFRCISAKPVRGQRNMSQSCLAGKVAIVTASTDGIGLAAAQALGQRGAHVVVSSRRQANVDRAVATLQSQDIRVTGTTCNVGKSQDREKLVQMALDQCGGIDILVSNAAVNPFFGNMLDSTEEVWDKALGPYSVSKTALLGLTRALAPELAQRNIRVNCVAPGVIKTQFSSCYSGSLRKSGGVIAFLCSKDASYITGETITVTGGINCRL